MGVITTGRLSEGSVFGPISTNLTLADPAVLIGHRTCDTLPDIHTVKLDVREHGHGGRLSEWVPYVRAARDCVEQNMEAFHVDGQMYFRIVKDIPENSELLIWYSPKFAIQLGVPELKEEYQKGDVFYCPRCRESFLFPNCLRAHLRFRCKFRSQATHYTSASQALETPEPIGSKAGIPIARLMATPYEVPNGSWPHFTRSSELSPSTGGGRGGGVGGGGGGGRGSPTASSSSSSSSRSPPGSVLRLVKRKPGSCDEDGPPGDSSPKRLSVSSPSPSPTGSAASSTFDGGRGCAAAEAVPGGSRLGRRHAVDDRGTKSAFQRVDRPPPPHHPPPPPSKMLSSASSSSSSYVTMTSTVLTPKTALNMTSLADNKGAGHNGVVGGGGGMMPGGGMLVFPHLPRLPLPMTATPESIHRLVTNENAPFGGGGVGGCGPAAFAGLQYINNNNIAMKLPYMAPDPTARLGLPFLYRSPNPVVDKMLQVVGSVGPMPSTFAALNLTQNWCAKCNTSFRMTSDLVYHMRSHHKREFDPVKKKKDDKLKCDVCGESFRERHHLTRHMTSHT